MKKFMAMLLSAVMMLSGTVFTQAADTIDIECVLSQDTVEVGETFYADFKVTDNPNGYNSMTTYFRYDPTVLRAVECEVEDIPSDLIIYRNEDGSAASLFSYINVNSRLNFVPKSGDRDYDGYADGKKTASEIGIIKLTSYLGASVDHFLQNYEGTGTLVRMKFEAIGSGSTAIELTDMSAAYFVQGASFDLAANISNGYVTVNGDAEPDNEPTTVAPTETTTEASVETTTASSSNSSTSDSSSSSSSTGGGSSTSVTTTTETTTSDSSTEVTTAAPVNSTDTTTKMGFVDVKAGDWFYEPVMNLAAAEVVNGYAEDNTFRPNNNVKRADFLLMLLRGIGVDTTVAPASNFDDVAVGKYYYNAVGIAKEMGIASGDGKNFNPESYITRQDMMILAKKALEISMNTTISGDVTVLDKFNDKAEISAYAVDSLAAMVSEGIVSGMGEDIAPKANTTRAQAVVIISKIMDKMM